MRFLKSAALNPSKTVAYILLNSLLQLFLILTVLVLAIKLRVWSFYVNFSEYFEMTLIRILVELITENALTNLFASATIVMIVALRRQGWIECLQISRKHVQYKPGFLVLTSSTFLFLMFGS